MTAAVPRPARQLVREDAGLVSVEAAFAFMLLFSLVVGIMEWAITFTVGSSLEQAAQLAGDVYFVSRDAPAALVEAERVMVTFARGCLSIDVTAYDSHSDYLSGTPAADPEAAALGRLRLSCAWTLVTPYMQSIVSDVFTMHAISVRPFE